MIHRFSLSGVGFLNYDRLAYIADLIRICTSVIVAHPVASFSVLVELPNLQEHLLLQPIL